MLAEAIVDALAAYRLTRLVQRDTLPPVVAARDWLRAHGPDYTVELLECPWCLGAWVAAAVTWARHRAPRQWQPAAATLATSAVVGLLLSQVDRPE